VSVITVGVDGSASARAAASFALEEARLRRATLRVVAAWHIPTAAFSDGMAPPVFGSELTDAAASVLEETLTGLGRHDVEIQGRVRHGQPAEVLLEESADADLLVVGSRGLGGFRGLLLGSVSQQCAQHARCPVVIVRADAAAPG
jgi:nucleotide-binding universal stress UspA family protein